MGSAWARRIAIRPPVTIVCRAKRRPHPTHRSDFVSESATRPLPLFYRKPQPLIPAIHEDVHLKDGDYGFAAETNAVPLAIIEFAQAMRHYPIVFSQVDGFPVAVLGLGQGNRFVTGGRWAESHYVPAYARRYPFVFIETAADSFALGLDVESDRMARGNEEGVALFADGKPTPLTEGARSEEHTSELQSLMRISYAVFCLKKKTNDQNIHIN